ncbi:MAG: BMP family ABC transporter substrate-binding protein [Bifidobacteriaceae bacterium]|jgi:basic membrane protein A|nr:BMP family ABC transporter substrate-binding protein [Bifidobacteriaceae bacterium]
MKGIIKKAIAAGSVFALSLGLAACSGGGDTPSDDGSGSGNSDFIGCVVSDGGGFQDKSFNQSALEGLTSAQASLGIQVKQAESKNENDYESNLKAMVANNCSLIVPVGFALSDATKASAEENPSVNYAIIDDDAISLPNVKPVVFDTAQASYLAGYLAAGYSKTHVLGTFGGMEFPSVQIFMDGFQQGAAKYDADNGTTTTVLGWDGEKKTGQYVGSFTDSTGGKTVAKAQIDQKADILFPVAGGAGLGAAAAAKEAGNVDVIWVDADGVLTQPDYAGVFLTSVMKNIAAAVETTISSMLGGAAFSNTPYVGTIENGGVGLAPYHEFESKVDSALQEKVTALQQEIASGAVKVESTFSPKAQ